MSRTKPHILWTLYRLWRAWRQCPHLRLGQLIENALWQEGDSPRRNRLFYIHDEVVIHAIDELVAHL